jgi:hypothetical protein
LSVIDSELVFFIYHLPLYLNKKSNRLDSFAAAAFLLCMSDVDSLNIYPKQIRFECFYFAIYGMGGLLRHL